MSHILTSGITRQSLPLCWADQSSNAEPLRASEQRLEPELQDTGSYLRDMDVYMSETSISYSVLVLISLGVFRFP